LSSLEKVLKTIKDVVPSGSAVKTWKNCPIIEVKIPSNIAESTKQQLIRAATIDGYNITINKAGGILGTIVLNEPDQKWRIRILQKKKTRSKGILNERYMADEVNSCYEEEALEPFTVEIATLSGKRNMIYGVKGAYSTGTDTNNRKKADLKLVTVSGVNYHISIKDTNAARWESADTFAKNISKKMLEHAQKQKLIDLRMVDFQDGKGHIILPYGSKLKASPTPAYTLSMKCSYADAKELVFGSDVGVFNGCIVNADFIRNPKPNQVTWDPEKSILKFMTTEIYYTLSDLPSTKYPYFVIRSTPTEKDRKVGDYQRLRVEAVPFDKIPTNNTWLLPEIH